MVLYLQNHNILAILCALIRHMCVWAGVRIVFMENSRAVWSGAFIFCVLLCLHLGDFSFSHVVGGFCLKASGCFSSFTII